MRARKLAWGRGPSRAVRRWAMARAMLACSAISRASRPVSSTRAWFGFRAAGNAITVQIRRDGIARHLLRGGKVPRVAPRPERRGYLLEETEDPYQGVRPCRVVQN